MAFDFLEKILRPLCIERITAREALYHPFLAEPNLPDDEMFPHPPSEGVCGELHFVDDVTDEHRARVYSQDGWKVYRIFAGEGIAVGNSPCEYHTNWVQQERLRDIDASREDMIDLDEE